MKTEHAGPKYIELSKEVVSLADEIRAKLKTVHSDLSRYCVHYAELKFIDETAANRGAAEITKFRYKRISLGFAVQTVYGRGAGYSGELLRFRYDPNDKDYFGWSTKLPVPDIKASANCAEVPVGDFIPEEYFELADDLSRTHRLVIPIPHKICASLEFFLKIYQNLNFSTITIRHCVEATLDLTEFSKTVLYIHVAIVKLGLMLTEQWTDVPSISVTIEESGNDLRVAVNGESIPLTPLETQSVVALSLLDYKNGLSVGAFAGLLPIPKEGTVPEAKTRFDTGLKFLKKFRPFTWTAKKGERFVKGIIIEKRVSNEVLRKYLSR